MNITSFIRGGLALAAVLSLSVPMAQAQQVEVNVVSSNPTYTEVIIDPYNQPFTLDQINVVSGQPNAINLMNFSSEPVIFSVPELAIQEEVEANSMEVVYVTPEAGTESLTAYILDADGNQLASTTLESEVVAYQFESTETVTYTQVEEETEVSSEEVETESQSTVRGFW